MDSILTSIKQLLGIAQDDDSFNNELVIHINSAISVLTQLGVGPVEGFRITGPDEEWSALIGARLDIENVKSVVYYRVRLAFDPPQNSNITGAINDQIKEFEWRMNVQRENDQWPLPTMTT